MILAIERRDLDGIWLRKAEENTESESVDRENDS